MIIKFRKVFDWLQQMQKWSLVIRSTAGIGVPCLHGIIAANRRRERPQKRWTDDIRQWTGINIVDCVQCAEDRSKCGDPWCPCRWLPILRL